MINIKNFPEKPGIYIFKNKDGNVLYVGKAKNLKKRIKQYFHSQSLKIQNLLKETANIEFIETANEAEAIFKESDLIKKLNPPYNQLLRDDTKYFYLIFTKEDFPKVLITHQPEKFKFQKIIGPFVEGTSLRKILNLLRKEIPFCTCLKKHQRICLNASLGLCYGFCCQEAYQPNKKDIKLYQRNLNIIEKIFKGNLLSLKKRILEKIKELLKKDEIEKAYYLKKVYEAIRKIEDSQDLIKEGFLIEHRLRKILISLQKLLSLKTIPHRIEAIDISHFAGKEKVGMVITFIDGVYQPKFLRKFKIKEVLKPNDPQMIYEVLKRRLKHQEWGLPDLILIDGGKAQFNFAEKAVKESGLDIKIIALAKPKELLYYHSQKKPYPLKENQELRNFILALDRKVHQLVLKYHREKREVKL